MNNGHKDISPSDFIALRKGNIKESYNFHSKLGSGAFSQVYLASHKITEQRRCIKVVGRDELGDENEDIMNEIKILKEMDHPNIMKIYEYFMTENHLYIVSEYLSGGELFDRIIEEKAFTEAKAAEYMRQILSAVSYLHKHKVTHRDLKPENIVFESKDANAHLKIIDFGTSKKLMENEKLKTRMGTAYYIAPEVLNGKYDQMCDIWSCGVILYIFLFGTPPFNGKTDDQIFAKIQKGVYSFPEKDSAKISSAAKNLIGRMLNFQPNKRPTADEILKDPWFYSNQELHVEFSVDVISNLKSFKSQYFFQKAILIYFVNFFSLKEEKDKLLSTFKSIDKDHDGQLTRKELIEAYKRISNHPNIEAEVDDIFKQLDFNNTDAIDFSEFLVATVNYRQNINDKQLKQIFQIIDKDKNGFLENNELREFFNLGGKDNEALLKKIVAEVDLNNDGVISFEEFQNIMKEFIHRI
jgi:calcium-dependent protein kinase